MLKAGKSKVWLRPALALLLLAMVALGYWWFLFPPSFLDRSLPEVVTVSPARNEFGVSPSSVLSVTFSKAMKPESINGSTLVLSDAQGRPVSARIRYQPSGSKAILEPEVALANSSRYKVSLRDGPSGVRDVHGKSLAREVSWSFMTGVWPPPPLDRGPGGPILVVTSAVNPFSVYYAEILRNEGFNEFQVADIAQVLPATLAQYDIVLLGEFPLPDDQSVILADWVRRGGNLIAMRPDRRLAREFGMKAKGSVLQDAYLAIDTSKAPGAGLVKETIQFHGPADLYEADEASDLATLYADASAVTTSPAVTLKHPGAGLAAVFTYDLARSVVFTRQGNPKWGGMERDGSRPIRSGDLFYGAASFDPQPDWVDFRRIQIPQADEQQRLLANLIVVMNYNKKPLPRFWYFPRGYKAVVIMTGDDHGHGGTVGRFMRFRQRDPPNCSLDEWQCVRGTSNVFVGTIAPADAWAVTQQGFEIGLHVYTGCEDWPTKAVRQPNGTVVKQIDRDEMNTIYSRQLTLFAVVYPDIPSPRTNRIDCVTWGDYDTQPQVELQHGIRLDTNYYYWPASWVRNRPGMFTGSGMPMRFAQSDGTLIDVYQAATQMTDESGQSYPFTVDTLLSNALGPKEYYGAFTANMHTDHSQSQGAEAIVAAAQARGVPIVTAGQMLTWLDGRNASSFQNLQWNGRDLQFTVVVGAGGNGIQALLPIRSAKGVLNGITVEDSPVDFAAKTTAGIEYAAFTARPGRYRASYR